MYLIKKMNGTEKKVILIGCIICMHSLRTVSKHCYQYAHKNIFLVLRKAVQNKSSVRLYGMYLLRSTIYST